MTPCCILGLSVFVGLLALPTDHEQNPVFQANIAEGIAFGEDSVTLPSPTFHDAQTAEEQREALKELAGTDRGAEALLRNSVTAPFLLRPGDQRGDEATLRTGALYFVLHLDFDSIDLEELSGKTEETESTFGPVEAGNMRFEGRLLDPADFLENLDSNSNSNSNSDSDSDANLQEWFIHTKGRLLDRIIVESTDRLTASRSEHSIVVASKTDPRFDNDDQWPNRWLAIERTRNTESEGESQPYAGSIGYARINRLKGVEGAVLVEAHFAFVEPRAWFDGAPILRSKFSLIAQDQIRKLRRELADGS